MREDNDLFNKEIVLTDNELEELVLTRCLSKDGILLKYDNNTPVGKQLRHNFEVMFETRYNKEK